MKKRLKKLKSDFLEHRFDEVLKDFPDCIEVIEQEKNTNIKNYHKLFVYSIVHLVYRLNEDKEEAKVYLEKMRALEIDSQKLSNRTYYEYIPFTRMGIKSLFKQEYYQKHYSTELLIEIRYDSGELGFVEDLFIIEGSDSWDITKTLLKYLTVLVGVMAITFWFVKIGMVETAIAFVFLSGVGFYVYFDYKIEYDNVSFCQDGCKIKNIGNNEKRII